MFIIHYKALLTFESVDRVPNCDSLGPDSLEEEKGEWTEQKIGAGDWGEKAAEKGFAALFISPVHHLAHFAPCSSSYKNKSLHLVKLTHNDIISVK